ncbi:MAG: quinoprotein dehydrogenase-associated SoxYZ-like carrier [Betaproteobacteria bacterium HGW-Betaproteobacteria-11]|nr:MAG: quinoprotein dehydrogenase-associated SoxYZ-like carrier [Betaproteobacteria bacterium HGW-Betaproteobacteria-11]
MRRIHRLVLGLFLLPALALAEAGDDPLGSPAWLDLKPYFVGNGRVVFDDRVKVSGPRFAEDSMNVPVGVRIENLPGIERVLVVADLNPITKILEFSPRGALPALYFRIKLQQATPVRALVLTKDGVWHADGIWIDATGGGCTAPSTGRGDPNWTRTLGSVQSQVWENDQQSRLKLKIMHPMDTGLAAGIPAFYIEQLALRDETGREWMRLKVYEPVSENPVFSFDFPGRTPPGLTLVGHDNNGNTINAKVAK